MARRAAGAQLDSGGADGRQTLGEGGQLLRRHPADERREPATAHRCPGAALQLDLARQQIAPSFALELGDGPRHGRQPRREGPGRSGLIGRLGSDALEPAQRLDRLALRRRQRADELDHAAVGDHAQHRA